MEKGTQTDPEPEVPHKTAVTVADQEVQTDEVPGMMELLDKGYYYYY